jgi:hypothetical protein
VVIVDRLADHFVLGARGSPGRPLRARSSWIARPTASCSQSMDLDRPTASNAFHCRRLFCRFCLSPRSERSEAARPWTSGGDESSSVDRRRGAVVAAEPLALTLDQRLGLEDRARAADTRRQIRRSNRPCAMGMAAYQTVSAAIHCATDLHHRRVVDNGCLTVVTTGDHHQPGSAARRVPPRPRRVDAA